MSCIYCGSESEIEREHVIPATFLGDRTYDDERQWVVRGCKTCNKLAGSAVFFSIPEKASYLVGRYKKNFRKILSIPTWTNEELGEVSEVIRAGIEESLVYRSIVGKRIEYLESVSEFSYDYKRPDWVTELMLEWRKQQQAEKKRKKEVRKRRKNML